jgi:hypothetical protein
MKNKKAIVIAVLALALVGIGAFGLMKPEPEYQPKVVATSADAGNDLADNGSGRDAGGGKQNEGKDLRAEQLMALVTGPLNPRDPFEQGGATAAEAVTAQPVVGNTPPPAATSARRSPSLPPLDPMGGSLAGPGGVGLSPGQPLRQPGEFGYRVKGVVVGDRPVAILEDDGGNQRMVPLGGSVDGDSRVVGIEKGRVRIRHRGKDQTLTISEGQ